jgi:uncharacterized protein (DUF983 family)
MPTKPWLLAILLPLLLASAVWAAAPLPDAELGLSEAQVAPGAPASGDEKASEIAVVQRKGLSLFGVAGIEAEHRFWNHRLYETRLQMPRGQWPTLMEGMRQAYGPPGSVESSLGDQRATWNLPIGRISAYQSTRYAIVSFTDSSQKDFRWSDLLAPVNLLVVGVLVAMLLLWFGVVHLLTSWCPNCRRFSMRLGGRTLSPAQDHSGELLSVDYQHDVTFRYRCSRCGHGKSERYSGFWSRKS